MSVVAFIPRSYTEDTYSSLFNLEAYLLLAYDKGTHQLNKYSSTLRGIQFNFLQFLNSKVRIQSSFEWSNFTIFC